MTQDPIILVKFVTTLETTSIDSQAFCYNYIDVVLANSIREVPGKSKWKFKMAFAMKGGGVSRGSRLPLSYFEK